MIRIIPVDYTTIRVDADPSVIAELSDRLTFEAPGAKFDARVRRGQWDGMIKLLNKKTQTCHAGLVDRIEEYAKEHGLPFSFVGRPRTDAQPTVDELLEFVRQIDVPEQYKPREHQIRAVLSAIKHRRRLFLSPTSSGKSLIIYILVRWYNLKTLVIVPSIGLVHQMTNDFVDYGCNPDDVHKIQEGREHITKDITVSTWQSIYKLEPEWFDQFGLVIGDEAHLFKAKSLIAIMSNLTRCAFRFGFTGTLDGSEVHQLVLEGLFGATEIVTTTKKLMDEGYVAKLKIEVILLNHSDKGKQIFTGLVKDAQAGQPRSRKGAIAYATEMGYLAVNGARNKFITKLGLNLPGNNLILFRQIEHGDRLFEMLHETNTSRPIHLINGGVDGLEREDIRAMVDASDDAILLASTGTTATGVSVRRINNLIMASPFKGRIINLQSIGRGLRLADDKKSCTVYDIADDLSTKDRVNHTLGHLNERVHIYAQESFDYRIHKIDLTY